MPGPFPYFDRPFLPPPAPACDLIISSGHSQRVYPALIDTGASATFIPASAIATLSLRPYGDDVEVTGGTGHKINERLYSVNLEFLGLRLTNRPVISLQGKPYAIIGRDILNKYNLALNGPGQEFSIY